MAADKKTVELLFQRPLEPVFTPRDNGKASFDLPDSYFTERYSEVRAELQSRYGDDMDTKIPLRDFPNKPNLDFAASLGKKRPFSLFNNKHKEIAGQLIQIFIDAKDVQHFAALCAYTKDRVNPFLFQYCLSVAVQHRPDTSEVQVPPIAETFPSNFVEPTVLQDARAEGTLITNPGSRIHIQIPPNYTASDREDEQRLAYFREDIGVNMHHWHWHLVYPTQGPKEVVDKDRRGELFYYMHHQVLARYNSERFSHSLARVKPLNNLRDPVAEGYFPKILNSLNNRTYAARTSNIKLQDINRDEATVEIADLERWRDRVHAAIDQGFVEDIYGKRIPLDEQHGVDILGNILEASSLSVNRQFYGNLHNEGHNLLSFAHDPDNRHLEDFNVMGDVTTAMRDPIFYRWHAFIDNIVNKYKALLPAYNETHLAFHGVSVDHVEAKISSISAAPNRLITYWQKSDVDLAAALDFGPDGNVYASFTHLQHAPFDYTFAVTNSTGDFKKGTCRVFICPKTDERNKPLSLEEQRLMAIEMDKFTVELQPGQNIIRRRSTESSVTIPFERSFRRVGKADMPKDANELARFRFCGCGWPEHLLLPKGKAEGMAFDLFVMISDYAGDAVEQINMSADICGDASSFCGLKDKLYPDKRTMGFPFDRKLPTDNLQELTTTFKNMAKSDVVIIFNDDIVARFN